MPRMTDDPGAEIAELQARLRACSASLEAANKELDTLCYAVSHDLRAPLRAVDGFSRMLMNRWQDRLDSEDRRLFNVVRTNSVTMGRMIDDLVGFSRLGRQPLRPTEIDMAALVSDVWAEAGAGFAGRLDLQALLPARGDRSLLKQAWVQLLSNAVKFSAGSADPVIVVRCQREGDEIVYGVRDNGIGFDMTYAHKLFAVFQRLHSSPDLPGTGMGLATVARIVNRHGGRVGAEGKDAGGATFWFALPAKPDPPAPSPSRRTGPTPSRP